MSKRGSNSEPFAHENDALTARPQLHEILSEVCGINNAVLIDNNQDDDDETGAVPTRPNTEEIKQAIEILAKLSLYCENGKDIRSGAVA